jgi:hypothetical protein
MEVIIEDEHRRFFQGRGWADKGFAAFSTIEILLGGLSCAQDLKAACCVFAACYH